MLRMMCEDLSFVLVRNRIISEDERDTYIYGLELLLTSLLVTFSILILGILLNELVITGAFLIVFCSLRTYSGGYHANQYWKCYCISCLTYLTIIVFLGRSSIEYNSLLGLVILSMTYISVFLIAPLNSKKNPKTQEDMRKNSIITKALLSTYTLIAAIGIFAYPSANKLWFTIVFTQLAVTVFLIVTIFQRRVLK